MNLLKEFKRRNIIKATIAYITVAWVLVQVLSIILPNFGAPSWVFKTLTFVIIVGFPLWMIFIWIYEITPEGLKKTDQVNQEFSTTTETNKRLNIIIITALLSILLITYFKKPSNLEISKITMEENMVKEKSIAVLPFADMSPYSDQEYFADGLSEELISTLTRLPDLRVIGRTSSFAFKGKNVDMREIGKSLNVSYILEGSVRKSKNRIRITAQLIDASDGLHLWSETFDRNFDEIFEIQDQISTSVANALKITLSNTNDLVKNRGVNSVAYNYFLKGKYIYEAAFDTEEIDEALQWFQEAIKADSAFSLAWAYSSNCLWVKRGDCFDLGPAKSAALKAFELDPTSGISAGVVANIAYLEYDFKEAQEKIELALKLEPNDPWVLRNAGWIYTILDREVESITYSQKALKNDPIQRISLNTLIKAYYYTGKYDKILSLMEKHWNLYGKEVFITREAYDALVRHPEKFHLLKELDGNTVFSNNLYYKLLISVIEKDKKNSENIINQMVEKQSHQPYLIAIAYTWIGEDEKVLDWLERAYEMKDTTLPYINVEPKFDNIRNNARFKKLINQMNYPD